MPKYIYVSGETFYLINELPGDDPIGSSYEAMHRDVFGHVGGQPCKAGSGASICGERGGEEGRGEERVGSGWG